MAKDKTSKSRAPSTDLFGAPQCSRGWGERCADAMHDECSCACGGRDHGTHYQTTRNHFGASDAMAVEKRAIRAFEMGPFGGYLNEYWNERTPLEKWRLITALKESL